MKEVPHQMNQLLLDPAFLGVIGVIVGSILSFSGTMLTQFLVTRKEERQWARQQAASKADRELSEQKERKKHEQDLFHNSLSALSVLLSRKWDSQDDLDYIKAVKEVHIWVSQIAVLFPENALLECIDHFTSDSQNYVAMNLQDCILKLVKLRASGNTPEMVGLPEKKEKGIRTIKFRIEENYWKSLIIQGIELPRDYELGYQISSIAPKHRQHLLESHYRTHKVIPDLAMLLLPTINNGNTVIYSTQWQCKLNPKETSVNKILDAWVEDFDKAFSRAPQAPEKSV